jgi:hypothetical protein
VTHRIRAKGGDDLSVVAADEGVDDVAADEDDWARVVDAEEAERERETRIVGPPCRTAEHHRPYP